MTTKVKHNRIPRNFKKIIGHIIVDSSAGKPAQWEIIKRTDDGAYIGTNLETRKEYRMFVSHLQNPDIFRIQNIIV